MPHAARMECAVSSTRWSSEIGDGRQVGITESTPPNCGSHQNDIETDSVVGELSS